MTDSYQRYLAAIDAVLDLPEAFRQQLSVADQDSTRETAQFARERERTSARYQALRDASAKEYRQVATSLAELGVGLPNLVRPAGASPSSLGDAQAAFASACEGARSLAQQINRSARIADRERAAADAAAGEAANRAADALRARQARLQARTSEPAVTAEPARSTTQEANQSASVAYVVIAIIVLLIVTAVLAAVVL
ncbi:hypothetical protein [Smaragdicoccus niigatensis]|uniref:hypothetical protein n=1 Tax=Smaragdicoccus niigatensis TaxID=359359 RepID=UPI0003735E39|nr:hypothetical protein [Smaragdicoccus niigatensis]